MKPANRPQMNHCGSELGEIYFLDSRILNQIFAEADSIKLRRTEETYRLRILSCVTSAKNCIVKAV